MMFDHFLLVYSTGSPTLSPVIPSFNGLSTVPKGTSGLVAVMDMFGFENRNEVSRDLNFSDHLSFPRVLLLNCCTLGVDTTKIKNLILKTVAHGLKCENIMPKSRRIPHHPHAKFIDFLFRQELTVYLYFLGQSA